jgi:hypothetical protein
MEGLIDKLHRTPPLILVILIAILFMILPLGCGFFIDDDPRGFLGNLAAECAGIGFTILVGYFLIEKLLKYHKDQQFAPARNFTLRAVANRLCDIASRVPEYFPVQDPSSVARILRGRNSFHNATVKGFGDLLAQLDQIPPNDFPACASCKEFYEAVKWDLDQIQTVLTPIVMLISEDQELINELMKFNHAGRELHNSILGYKLIRLGSIRQNVRSLVEHSRQLYQALL